MYTKQTARKSTASHTCVPRFKLPKKVEKPKVEEKVERKKKEKPEPRPVEEVTCSYCDFTSTSSAAVRSHTRLEHKLMLRKIKPNQTEITQPSRL